MSWFSDLTGFDSETPQSVRDRVSVEGTTLVCHANAQRYEIGRLETPALADLRSVGMANNGSIQVREIIADVQALHLDPANAGAVFQVASQFNLLEMVGPSVAPEDGVTRYQDDPTQGPACAIACGAGTIYRNYFHPVRGGIGQSRDRQIDCLEDLGQMLGNGEHRYWTMQNGYALPSVSGLSALDMALKAMSEAQLDRLRGALRVGVQADTEVTLTNAGHVVTQVLCSALPVSYAPLGAAAWQRFASLVLEAAYEATLHVAAQHAQRTGNNRVFLTMLGGGAFGNRSDWIASAVVRALRIHERCGLDVYLVSYGGPSALAEEVLSRLSVERR